jgi:hypothetical protein
MKTQEQLIQEAFAFYNGGKGLDHWSYSFYIITILKKYN